MGNPDFFKAVNEQLSKVALEDWKTYLRWRRLDSYAPLLSKPFVDEDLEFSRKIMAGQKEIEPRWKRRVHSTNNSQSWPPWSITSDIPTNGVTTAA